MILMAMQFQSVRDLVRAAQGIERVMRDTAKPVIEQGQTTGFKRRDSGFSSGRPPFQKKGKNAQMSGQFQKRGGSFNQGVVREDSDRLTEQDPGEVRSDREP